MMPLSEMQKRVIAGGLTALALTLVLAFVSAVVWGVFRFLSFASSAIIPVVLGFILALFFKPYYRWWLGRVRNPTLALILMLLTVLVPAGLIFWYAGAVIIDQVNNLIEQGPTLINLVVQWFRVTFPKLYGLMLQMGASPENAGALYSKYGMTALQAGFGALKFFSVFLTILLSLIFFVFFLMTKERRGGELVEMLPFVKPETKRFIAQEVDVFVDILVSFFQRQTIICLIEGLMYGMGFWLVGLPYGFLIGFSLGILNLIPLFGTVVCLPVALPLAYFTHGGSLTRLAMVLVVWGCGQLLDGYFITPKIQGGKTGLGYAGVIFSFVFWATVLGPMLGMLLAIPLSAFCVVLWRAVRERLEGSVK